MQFHEYTSVKQRLLREASPSARDGLKKLTLSQFRGTLINAVMQGTDQRNVYGYQASARRDLGRA